MQCYIIRHIKVIYNRFLTENNVLLWQKIMKVNLMKDNGALFASMGLHGHTGH